MGKLQSGGYATAPLKRYPKGLCRAISRMIQVAGGTAATTAPSSNDGLQQAVDALQTGYDCVHDNLEDGADFCGLDPVQANSFGFN